MTRYRTMTGTQYPCNTSCDVCGWMRALWNAMGLTPEPLRCSKHRDAAKSEVRR